MQQLKRIDFLNCPLDALTMQETVEAIDAAIKQRWFVQHVVVNVAKFVNMRKDAELDASVRTCDIINIDGMGVVWGSRLLGYTVPERVAGIDLFYELLKLSAQQGYPVFLLGAEQDVVMKAADVISGLYPNLNIAGYHHGYFWDDEAAVVNEIRSSKARLLFVAITSPEKENFINKWKDQLGVDFVMGVGGSFDVVAGKVKRAPIWMQNSGLEWLFRIIQEPKRMWKRYLITNSQFAWLLLKEVVRNKHLSSRSLIR